ncbi:ubiquitin domain protein, putative [Talaromyces stipitatus ATCC 10500]|uniref:Ubiquitin domain protein, putative n=1 Tax=Talaromyces stipitatus (strain ATCC 10500 / CBS 375.48 / QM 6759 / NRRL 1006) TaxID=441959 RepID=B8LVN0_TALSN|nr:ubiquitin domain protein, putative [Talaromyces stipitatus ATCC 10500]EED24160.1 ubiquitin domain protein, putative [Talaromyces stipitatus ATCC 10500]
MGCCLSRSSNEEQPFHASTATQEPQEDALSTHHSEQHSRQQASNSSTRRRSRPRCQGVALPLDQHYNQPIRPHIWRSKRRLWTRTQIDREREEFFDTRVTGREEVWAALRAALSLLREGDIETAQGIIDAAGVTVPTGDFCDGCYDENGVLYRLPQCIVSDPDNIADDSGAAAGETDGVDDDMEDGISDRKIVSEESDEELISEDAERRREEKGKMSERDMIRVQARLSDRGGPDVMISIGKTQNVSLLARKIHSETKMSNTQRVRIVYLGRVLRENEPLVDQGWKQGHVINAMVVARPAS